MLLLSGSLRKFIKNSVIRFVYALSLALLLFNFVHLILFMNEMRVLVKQEKEFLVQRQIKAEFLVMESKIDLDRAINKKAYPGLKKIYLLFLDYF